MVTAVPSTVVPSRKVTVLPASAVPVRVGRVTLVLLSPAVPLSLAGSSEGVATMGAAVSITRANGAEVAVLPAASVAVAVMECVPSAREEVSVGA